MSTTYYKSEVCIVGGGPAGMICGLDLARRGIDVLVLEKNKNFDREFRGEVLQPRFMHLAEQMGLMDLVKSIPHTEFADLRLFANGELQGKVSLARIDREFPYITWMTQPALLSGLLDEAEKYPNFKILFSSEVDRLLMEDGVCAGVAFSQEGAEATVSCNVVVGCDGRFSKVRRLLDAKLAYSSHRFDVMWFEMKRPDSYTHGADFFLSASLNCLVLPKHPDKIQCGILIKPRSLRQERKSGAKSIAAKLKRVHPMFCDFADELINFDSFTVLQAKIEMVEEWARDGVVLIGDAAHTCSPAGAIGVTIASETAAVAAMVLEQCVKERDFSQLALGRIQQQRYEAVRKVHRTQALAAGAIVGNPLTRRMAPYIAGLAIRTGLAPLVMRQLISRGPSFTV